MLSEVLCSLINVRLRIRSANAAAATAELRSVGSGFQTILGARVEVARSDEALAMSDVQLWPSKSRLLCNKWVFVSLSPVARLKQPVAMCELYGTPCWFPWRLAQPMMLAHVLVGDAPFRLKETTWDMPTIKLLAEVYLETL